VKKENARKSGKEGEKGNLCAVSVLKTILTFFGNARKSGKEREYGIP